MTEPEVIPADSPEAIRIAALLHPEAFALVPRADPFAVDFAALAQLLDPALPEEP